MVVAHLTTPVLELDPALGLLWSAHTAPGYLTRIEPGARVHLVVGSLDHAERLLRVSPAAAGEASAVLDAVLVHQDIDPASPTYGVFPWIHEEPMGEWTKPDPNTADFAGAALGQILRVHADLLPEDTRDRACAAVRRCIAQIQRRDVSLGYTNIALMGAGVCVVAGELLADESALAYGRDKLERLVTQAQSVEGFSEYNSPAYTPVVLRECERILSLARDPRSLAAAEAVRRVAWRVVATHFHPGTAQWAGPHSRAYHDHLTAETAAFLAARTGRAIAPRHMPAAPPPSQPTPSSACPKDLAAAFAPWRPGRAPHETVQVFSRRDLRPNDDVIGTTWMSEDATLGSVNHDTLRDQRRALVGYWRTPEDPAVCLRARLLKNGRDWASGYVRAVQRGPRVLASFHLLTNQGDLYPFDRPDDGCFTVSDLRIRIQLRGRGVRGESLAGGRHALVAGERRVVVHPGPAVCEGREIAWEAGGDEEGVWLDGVAYAGRGRVAPVTAWGPFWISLGLELLGPGESPASDAPGDAPAGEGHVELAWNPGPELRRRVPTMPEFYPYLLCPDKV